MPRRFTIAICLLAAILVVGILGFVFWTTPRKTVNAIDRRDLSSQNEQAESPKTVTDTRFEIRLVAWNVESGGSEPAVIAEQLRAFASFDVVGLSEVSPKAVPQYQSAMSQFECFLGSSGNDDRLLLLINTERFKILERKELDRFEDYSLNDGRHRSPLMIRLRDTVMGIDLVVINNHLARGNAEMRKSQAIGLREWARHQTTPVIAVGDYNFDYAFATGQGNEAFVEFMQDGIWEWIRPEPLVDSNWADNNKDGIDDYPDSLLDFVFAAGPAKDWDLQCKVQTAKGDFPDDDKSSDHRPVVIAVNFQ